MMIVFIIKMYLKGWSVFMSREVCPNWGKLQDCIFVIPTVSNHNTLRFKPPTTPRFTD